MCLAGEEEPGGSSAGAGGGSGSVPEIVVTGSRIGLNMDVYQTIDWAEVGKLASIGALAGIPSGWQGVVAGGLGGAAMSIESQDGVDIEDLFELKDDMIIIPGLNPYMYLH
jgi:hypothetical protein